MSVNSPTLTVPVIDASYAVPPPWRKVLFLDVDGVLNSMDWFTTPPQKAATTLDPKAVGMIRDVCDLTGTQVVLSSSWRHSRDLVQILVDAGINLIGLTPRIDDAPRGAEITSWLADNLEVLKYAVVDDDPDAGYGHEGVYVRTYFKHGLYGRHKKRLLGLLADGTQSRG